MTSVAYTSLQDNESWLTDREGFTRDGTARKGMFSTQGVAHGNQEASQGVDSVRNWREAVDKQSGKIYYYNRVTKETSWKPPSGWLEHRTTEEVSSRNVNTKENRKKFGNIRNPQTMDIQKAVDPRTGRWYYYDRHTRETFWNDPRKLNPDDIYESKHGSYAKRSTYSLQQPSDAQNEYFDKETADEGHKVDSAKRLLNADGAPTHNDSEQHVSSVSQDTHGRRNLHSDNNEAGGTGTQNLRSSKLYEEESDGAKVQDSGFSSSGVKSSLQLLKKKMKTRTHANTGAKQTLQREAQPASHVPDAQTPSKQPESTMKGTFSTPKKCLRKSGCLCSSCRFAGALASPEIVANGLPVAQETQHIEQQACRLCGRKFNPNSLQIHERVCRKVFSGKKKTPSSKAKTTPARSNRNGSSTKNATSWRARSQQIRAAMRSMKNVAEGTPNGARSRKSPQVGSSAEPTTPSDSQFDLKECPHCHRTFNEKAASRHIPVCKSIKAKPKLLRRGEGKGAYKRSIKTNTSEEERRSDSGQRPFSASVEKLNPNSRSTPARRRPGTAGGRSTSRVSVTQNGVQLRPCPNCGRQFSYKAFDRHTEYCTQKLEEQARDTAKRSLLRSSLDFNGRISPRILDGNGRRQTISFGQRFVKDTSYDEPLEDYYNDGGGFEDGQDYTFGSHYEAALKAVNLGRAGQQDGEDYWNRESESGIQLAGQGREPYMNYSSYQTDMSFRNDDLYGKRDAYGGVDSDDNYSADSY